MTSDNKASRLSKGGVEGFVKKSFTEVSSTGYRSCLKIIQVSAGQGKNRRESAVYRRVNKHFEPIFNAVICQLNNFKTAS